MQSGHVSKLSKLSRLQRACAVILLAYVVVAAVLYFAAAVDWDRQGTQVTLMTADKNLGVMVGDTVVEQRYTPKTQFIDRIEPSFRRIGSALGALTVEVEQAGAIKGTLTLPLSALKGETYEVLTFPEPVAVVPGDEIILRFLMPQLDAQSGITLAYGDTRPTARGALPVEDTVAFTHNGQPIKGALAMKVVGHSYYHLSRIYLAAATFVFLALVVTMVFQIKKFRKNQTSWIIRLITVLNRYSYLLHQMVSRDFHVKYKRSVLGVLWSFLNPLLTMAVYYFVFSTLFRNTTENFLLYLLTGIVTFSYFSEASSMGLLAIVNNASLITKVYVPKFIYPVVPVFSATINMLFSLIPVLAVMLLTGVAFTKAILLLPLAVLFIMVFSIGVSYILSTLMVFFRDTRFLWGVLVMLWNFLTPVFYTEDIIPMAFRWLYRMNPLYQFLFFLRSILINGVSPNPVTYLYCTVAAVVPLVIGLTLFKRNQNKFAFNL